MSFRFGAALLAGTAALGLAAPARAQLNMICAPAVEWCQALGTGFERATGHGQPGQIVEDLGQHLLVDPLFGRSGEIVGRQGGAVVPLQFFHALSAHEQAC